MSPHKRIFNPFLHVAVPITEDYYPQSALQIAKAIKQDTRLLGLVCMSESESLSTGAAAARRLRQQIKEIRDGWGINGPDQIEVSQTPWANLIQLLQDDPPDLLLLEWPGHFNCLGVTPAEALVEPPCNVALVRGPLPEQIAKILVPIRGGPFAELALRVALSIPNHEVNALHLTPPGSRSTEETAFLGLARVLPNLSGVQYREETSTDPGAVILQEASQVDLIVMGASSLQPPQAGFGIGRVASQILESAPCAAMIVRSQRTLPSQWTGIAGLSAGTQAISILVDKWFAENTFHADEFDDLQRLVTLKQAQNLTISLALPALNEEETVREVVQTIQHSLIKRFPLLDELVLIDSNSSDRTREIATSCGIPVFIHQDLLPQYGSRSGKGEALWKSLLVTKGDLVIWIDTDIVNIHPRFVYGVIGPLLLNPKIQFVKGFYQRPLRTSERTMATGGGRVTELTARPLLNLFYPELSGVIQPLSGEYGGRRSALEQFSFFSGYGVETGLLIDVFEKFGLNAIAQVDLLERVHHNQSLEALSKMSFSIIQAFIRKLEKRYNIPFLDEINKSMKLIHYLDGNYYLDVQEVAELERPPMVQVSEYGQIHSLGGTSNHDKR